MSRMTDRIRQLLVRHGAKKVRVSEDAEEKGVFHAEMAAMNPLDRQAIAQVVADKIGLHVEGGGTFLGFGLAPATSDVSFSTKKRKS